MKHTILHKQLNIPNHFQIHFIPHTLTLYHNNLIPFTLYLIPFTLPHDNLYHTLSNSLYTIHFNFIPFKSLYTTLTPTLALYTLTYVTCPPYIRCPPYLPNILCHTLSNSLYTIHFNFIPFKTLYTTLTPTYKSL